MKKFSYGMLAVGVLMLITGCRKKKEPTVAPQAQAPAITVPAAPSQSPSTTQPSATKPTPAPANTAPPASTPVKKTKKKKRKPRTQVAKKTGATETQPATPATTAAARAPTATPSAAATPNSPSAASAPPSDSGTGDISAAMDHSQEARQREMTQQLLSSTDANLKGITRPLTADERAMVDEIRNYMAQSRAAITDGDFTRASNLATKAHLLSDELVKH